MCVMCRRRKRVSDYARHDDGPEVREVEGGVPQAYLQGLMIDYYRANVNAFASKIVEIECA